MKKEPFLFYFFTPPPKFILNLLSNPAPPPFLPYPLALENEKWDTQSKTVRNKPNTSQKKKKSSPTWNRLKTTKNASPAAGPTSIHDNPLIHTITTEPHAPIPIPTHPEGIIMGTTCSARNKHTKTAVKKSIQRSKNVTVWCHVVGDRVERVYDIVVGEGQRTVR